MTAAPAASKRPRPAEVEPPVVGERADGAKFGGLNPAFWFGQLDLRAISIFRVGFGLFIIYDLFELLSNASVWFADTGVMPRTTVLAELVRPNRFCLLDAFGSPIWIVYLYFAIAIVTFGFMVVGYRTKTAQIIGYIFLLGVNERLPQLFDGSDSVIRLTLFWLLFCPSANRYSLDAMLAARDGRPRPRTSIALPMRIVQLQVAWVYYCTVWHKMGGNTWTTGPVPNAANFFGSPALHYVLHLSHVFGRPWSAMLADQPLAMTIGTWFTIGFESSFVFLVLFPFFNKYTKALALIAGVMLHFGINATMNVGLFSVLMPVTYLAFLEPEWVEGLLNRLAWFCGRRGPTRVLYDGECPVCRDSAALLKMMDRFGNLELIDFRSGELPAEIAGKVKPKALELRMHAVDADGSIHVGFGALAALSARLPALFVLAPLMSLPGIYQLGDWIYGWVADHRHALGVCTDESCGVHRPAASIPQLFSETTRSRAKGLSVIAVAALFTFSCWYSGPRVITKDLPRDAEQVVQMFGLWSIWDMFSPEPLRTDYHLRAPAEFSDGTTEDLFGGPTDGPGEVRGFWFSRWWKYMENVTGGGETLPRGWANWECRTHNFNNDPRKLFTFNLKKENQIIPPIGQPWPPVFVDTVWIQRCYDKKN